MCTDACAFREWKYPKVRFVSVCWVRAVTNAGVGLVSAHDYSVGPRSPSVNVAQARRLVLDFRFIVNDLPPSAVMYFLRDASLLTVKRFPRRSPTVDQVCTFPHPSFQMAKSVAKYSIMTQEMVDSFSEAFYILAEVHPTAPGRDKTIILFLAGKVGVYTRIFYYCGYRIPFTKFFMVVLKYFRIHISQLSPFGAARVSHFEVLTRVLNLAPSITVFRTFYTRSYSDGLFSFAKRSTTAPSCFTKPPDSIKNWTGHFFWVDSCAFPISVPLYTGGILEKDSAPHLTERQEETVRLLESHKDPFCRYPECFLCQVGLSKYYPFDDNSYPAYEYSNGSDI
ncbi:hypothetical protein Tco_1098516, partial [Tanacetum coccineum]